MARNEFCNENGIFSDKSNAFWSNVTKQVARFCCPSVYRSLIAAAHVTQKLATLTYQERPSRSCALEFPPSLSPF